MRDLDYYIYKNESKYAIKAFRICPFDIVNAGQLTILRPKGEGYGFRIGVLDKKNNVVIEVYTECAYDYIITNSSNSVNKCEVIPNNRYAYMPVYVSSNELTEKDRKFIKRVIKKLEKGKNFYNGNDVYDNEQYLHLIDKITLQNELEKIDEPKRYCKKICKKM